MSQAIIHDASTEVVSAYSRSTPGNAIVFQARITTLAGTGAAVAGEGNAIKIADVTSIARTIFEASGSAPQTGGTPTAPVVATTILDTLTNDEIWTTDSIGRNFIDQVTTLTTANTIYRVQYAILLASGQTRTIVFQHTTDSAGAT